jgi:hypothetical protein
MRLKTIVAALSLSLVCMVSRVSFADTLTLITAGGETSGGEFVYPYYLTDSGPGGITPMVAMGCLNVDRDINFGESWQVYGVNVSTVTLSETIDSESGLDILADAYLFNQFAGANGNGYLISDIQWAIWSVMDPSAVAGNIAFTPNAQSLAATALSVAPILLSGYFANDNMFVPINGTQTAGYGEPQILMTDPVPPTATPEPTSLILMGTGMLSAVAIMRRKYRKVALGRRLARTRCSSASCEARLLPFWLPAVQSGSAVSVGSAEVKRLG